MAKTTNKNKFKPSVLSVSSLVILIIYALIWVAVLAWTLLFSVTDFSTDIWKTADRSYLTIPSKICLENFEKVYNSIFVTVEYGKVTRDVGFLEQFGNSLLYGIGSSFFAALSPCLVAYATARFKLKFTPVIETVVMVTMILPVVGSLPSQISLVYNLNLNDSFIGLWIMSFAFTNMYYFVYKAVFKALPDAISEAASIDGASNLRIFTTIMLPLVATTFFSVMLIFFVQLWNNYTNILAFAPNRPTAAFGLYKFMRSTRVSEPTLKMTGAIILMAPVIILFTLFNKKLMGNLTMGGVKG